METIHLEILGADSTIWENYCKVFKNSEFSESLKDLPMIPRPRSRPSRKHKKEKFDKDKKLIEDLVKIIKSESSSSLCFSEEYCSSNKYNIKELDVNKIKSKTQQIEDRIKQLDNAPNEPFKISEHRHIHCEFCEDVRIVHGNHIDYLHDAELHYVDNAGMVYPHKLPVSNDHPNDCSPFLQWTWQNPQDYVNIIDDIECLKTSLIMSQRTVNLSEQCKQSDQIQTSKNCCHNHSDN